MLNLLECDECEGISKLTDKRHEEKDARFYTHEDRLIEDDISELKYQRKPGDYECEYAFRLAMMLPADEMGPCVRGTWPRCRPITTDSSGAGRKRTRSTVTTRWRCSILHVRDDPNKISEPADENPETWPVLDYCTGLSKARDTMWNSAHPNNVNLDSLMDLSNPNEKTNIANPANPARSSGWPRGNPLRAPKIPRSKSSASTSSSHGKSRSKTKGPTPKKKPLLKSTNCN